MDRVIADLDNQFPSIENALVQREMATAQTLQHYLNTPNGEDYGFAPQIDHGAGPENRVAGLYLASAFTGGGGYTGAMLGGGSAARAALAVTEEPLANEHTEPLTSAS